ncbi:EVE domain-containing protein [Candidatus Methylospira mobilis]|uniref:EVE domain-containing protein n=1 Tax=Candidatus Methylospira mobilis TaxID=1808979 RepID=A0A5Q0BMQ7_9GAMM|nr:EVE domain-containing protein [Candidatus Methylospira mobilis]QFY45123.1 EVE domain-containing protein [Candidatus Methylospira mobilis]
MNFWLMKTEPGAFSLDDLISRPGQIEPWDGVRNYQARNMMRDQMKVGDPVFFYHSNCEIPGIAGIVRIAREAYPDHTAFDPVHKHYDPGSSPENPRWLMVDVQFVRRLQRIISLAELKTHASALDGFALLRKGNRLSVMAVDARHWAFIEALETITQRG